MKNVLIVWSEIPENIASFISMSVDEETATKLERYNNQYINSTEIDDDLATEMNEFFYPGFGYFKFKDLESKDPIINVAYDLIVHCGFVL